MVILDITVVNVALPSIGEDLAFVEGDLQWVITAYVLFTGGLLMLGGRATDVFRRRRVFLYGQTTKTGSAGGFWSSRANMSAQNRYCCVRPCRDLAARLVGARARRGSGSGLVSWLLRRAGDGAAMPGERSGRCGERGEPDPGDQPAG